MKPNVRPADVRDEASIIAFDHIAGTDPRRVQLIRQSIDAGQCWVVEGGTGVAGYGILDYSFYDCGFIQMLYVHPGCRRQGFGTALLGHLETICVTEKLFTSTNRSNRAMQALLEKTGFASSGTIENLDAGDPELVYFKRLPDRA